MPAPSSSRLFRERTGRVVEAKGIEVPPTLHRRGCFVSELDELVQRGCTSLGLRLSQDSVERCSAYARLLEKWGSRINLTSTPRAREFISHHILDAVALLAHLPSQARTAVSPGGARAVDVGSGAGIPGVVVAIARPELELVALEPVRKKHAFLRAVRRELGLKNFSPLAVRVEDHLEDEAFTPYLVAMSRATFDLGSWLRLAHRLSPQGWLLGMEGAHKHVLPAGAERFPYELPFDSSRSRSIIVISPGRHETPKTAG